MAEKQDASGKKWGPGRWLAWTLGVTAGLLLALVLAGFFLVPPLARSQLESQLSGALHRQVHVERVRVNPLALTLAVEGLSVLEPDNATTFLSCGRLFLDLDAVSLPTLTLRASELRVENPYVRLAFTGNGTANFSDLLAGDGAAEPAPSEPVEPSSPSGPGPNLPVVLRSLAVTGGDFVVEDQVLGKRHEVRDFNLSVPFASLLPEDSEAYVEPSLSAEVNGQPLRLRGRTLPFAASRRTEFDFGLEDADLAEYWAYAPVPAGLALTSGRLSCNASVVLEETGELLPLLFVRGDFSLRDLALAGPGGEQLASLAGLDFTLSRFSLLESRLDLDRVAVRGLAADLARRKDGSLNWSGLVPADDSDNTSGDGPAAASGNATVEAAAVLGPPFVVSCADLDLEQGSLRFTDQAVPGGFTAHLDDIALHAANATTGPGGPGPASFNLAATGTVQFSAAGSLSLQPLDLDAAVSLAGLDLPSLAPYLGGSLPLRVAAGTAGVSGRLRYGPKGLALSGLDLTVTGPALALPKRAEPFLRLDRLVLAQAGVNLAARSVSAGSLRLEGGQLRAVRRADGSVDLAGLAGAGEGGESSAPSSGPAWDVRLGKAEVAGLGVAFTDLAAGPRAKLELKSLDLGLDNLGLDLSRPVPLRLAVALKPTGKLALAATLVPGTPSLRGRVELSGLPLPLARPWLPADLAVRPERGSLSLAGDLDLAAGDELSLDFSGDAEVRGLGLAAGERSEAASLDLVKVSGLRLALPGGRTRAGEVELEELVLPDPGGDRPALSLGRLRASGLDLNLDGRVVSLERLILAAPAAWLERTATGMNLGRALAPFAGQGEAAPAQPKPQAEAGPFTVRLKLARVFGGAVGFHDTTLSPAVTLRLMRLGGRGENLSTAPGERGTLSLNATVERSAPLLLDSNLAPGAETLDAAGTLSLKGLDLAPLNPYLIAYTGYPADTGKLDAALDLAVSGETLSGENHILVRGLELGPRATSVKDPAVPIELAMSLLADSSGNLALDIPISGRLDDPQFNLGKVIASAITGMLGKLVTAPFSFLGSVFSLVGGSNLEQGTVPFAPGSVALGPEAEKALSAVADAMAKRPRLEVTTAGVAVPASDAAALKQALFLGKLKVRKFRDLKRKRQGPASPELVEIPPDEYEHWLTEAYDAEPMDKPRNFLGLAKKQPREEMERLLQAATPVGDQDLLDLAAARADAARDFLLAAGVPADRVFARAPALAESGSGMVKLGLR